MSDHRRQEPRYSQHLVPDSDVMDRLLRYQSAVDRRLDRSVAELEPLQRRRLGSVVPASLNLTM
jgi:hypothetical protein